VLTLDKSEFPQSCAEFLAERLCVVICQNLAHNPSDVRALRVRRERPSRCAAKERDELAPFHVWMAPAWQEIIWRAAQRSLAVMCPACWCSPGGLLALMGSANRVLIIRTGSMSR